MKYQISIYMESDVYNSISEKYVLFLEDLS